ncbi:hypothetical protein CHISP_2669 [Chitinispirillum alkaliphilum]|nr:hypothetical protein CHISP_2669 [Chitinispirillum alkaliphilum]
MGISPEMRSFIEEKITALTEADYQRIPMGIQDFFDEKSAVMAQVHKDKDALIAAGFDWDRMEEFEACFEMLLLAHGQRVVSIPDNPDERATYYSELAIAEDDRKVLRLVLDYIAQETNDRDVQRIYRMIQSGHGMVDTMVDNISFTKIISRYPELASQIRPGGRMVTPEYLEEVKRRSLTLLRMRGVVVRDGVPANEAVDYQNRIITLCVQALTYVRRFARAAFYNDLSYYNSNYASRRRTSSASGEQSVMDEVSMEQELESV